MRERRKGDHVREGEEVREEEESLLGEGRLLGSTWLEEVAVGEAGATTQHSSPGIASWGRRRRRRRRR